VSRRDIFDKTDPPNLHFVLSESCLRRVWGDANVMREQTNYLIKLSDMPNVMIQVMPFDAPPGRRSSIGDRFTLVRVPSPGSPGHLSSRMSRRSARYGTWTTRTLSPRTT
jgi:hypothetical protein